MYKFLVLVFLCASFAQVRGDELEEAIEEGLVVASDLYASGQQNIENANLEVETVQNNIKDKTEEYIGKSVASQEKVAKALRAIAQAMEDRALATNQPESVINCIRSNEDEGNAQVGKLTSKFDVDINRLEGNKLNLTKTYVKPLEPMPEALRVRYERNIKIINECTFPKCVEIANNSFAKWIIDMTANIERILTQVKTQFKNYQRDGFNYLYNSQRQVDLAKNAAIRKIKACMPSQETTTQTNIEN